MLVTFGAPPVLRPYQADAIERLRAEIRQGRRRLILQASTGAGKTVIAADIIRRTVEKGGRVLFLAHARELIKQCSDKLWDVGVPHGLLMAGRGYQLSEPVQVASKDTLLSRAIRLGTLRLPEASLVVADECHRSLSRWWRYLLDQYPRAVILGLTATPARSDGRGLGDLYQAMVQAVPTSQLIQDGYLVSTKVYAPYRPNLKGIRVERGDYNREQLAARLNKKNLLNRGSAVQLFTTPRDDNSLVRHPFKIGAQFHG